MKKSKNSQKTDTRVRTFKISAMLDDQLRSVAQAEGITVSAVIAEAIVSYLRGYRVRVKNEEWFNDERGLLIKKPISDRLKRHKKEKEGEL